MSWYRCTGGNGGSGAVSEVVRIAEREWQTGGGPSGDLKKYEVKTISTGGSDATVRVIEYDRNDVVLQTVDILFKTVLSSYTQVGSIEVGYPSDWKIRAYNDVEYNGTTYTAGSDILTWAYNTSVDYTDLISGEYLPYPAQNDKIYLVTNDTGDMVKYQFQGNRRILRKSNISAYEFWYEDLFFPIGMAGNSSSYINGYQHYWINTGIKLFSTENRGRSWQMEFNIKPMDGSGSSSELVIFGTNTNNDSRYFEFYVRSNVTNLYLYGANFSDDNCGDIVNKDVVIQYDYDNSTLTVTVDGVVTKTKNYSWVADETNTLYIANYRGSYCFNGMMNYIGFKWLD